MFKTMKSVFDARTLFLLAITACAWGCGAREDIKYPVTGAVFYRGKPLPLGRVFFAPAEGGDLTSASIAANGQYVLEAISGPHQVKIMAQPPRKGRLDPTVEGGVDYSGFPVPKPLIPKKYGSFATSGLRVNVEPSDNNQIDFNLD